MRHYLRLLRNVKIINKMSKKSTALSTLRFLRVLKNLKKDQRSIIIEHLSDHGVDVLCHCIYNLVYEDHKLKRATKRKLKRIFKGKEKEIDFVSKKSNNIKRRREILVKQFGGSIIPTLLTVALPLLTNLLFRSRK